MRHKPISQFPQGKNGASCFQLALFFALSISLINPLWAQSKVKEKVVHNALADRIEKLLSEKKKKEALSLLVTELGTTVKSRVKKELSKAALLQAQENYELYLRLSRTFETDRAQQLYELAMASKKTNTAIASQKIDEALMVEPTQLLLLLEKVRLALAKKDCQNAAEILTPQKEKFFFDEEVLLLWTQQQLCAQKNIEGQVLVLKKQVLVPKLEWMWTAIDIQQKFALKHWVSAWEDVEKLKKIDMKYPETHYFEWVIGFQTKNYRVSTAQKYLSQCEEMTGMLARKYNADPMLCQRVADVTEDLNNLKKKQNSP